MGGIPNERTGDRQRSFLGPEEREDRDGRGRRDAERSMSLHGQPADEEAEDPVQGPPRCTRCNTPGARSDIFPGQSRSEVRDPRGVLRSVASARNAALGSPPCDLGFVGERLGGESDVPRERWRLVRGDATTPAKPAMAEEPGARRRAPRRGITEALGVSSASSQPSKPGAVEKRSVAPMPWTRVPW